MKVSSIKFSEGIFKKLTTDKWQVFKPVFCEIELLNEGVIQIEIYKGFKFNFRSGGLFIDWVIPKIGDFWIAWLVHDSLYASKEYPKYMADEIMKIILDMLGMSKFKQWLAFKAVDQFGQEGYDKFEPENDGLVVIHHSDKGKRRNWYRIIKQNLKG